MVSQIPQNTAERVKFANSATKYIMDTPLKEAGALDEVGMSTAMGLGFGGAISGVQGGIFAFKNRGHVIENAKKLNADYKTIFKNTNLGFAKTNYRGLELYKKTQDPAIRTSIKEALAKGTTKEAQAALDGAEAQIKAAPKTGAFAKIGACFTKFKQVTGLEAAGNFMAQKLPRVTKFFKGCGAPFIIAIEGGIETFTEIIPAFKEGGIKEGLPQLGKSTVKTVASVAGFAAGMKAGAVIGGAVGSVVPVLGTVVGMIVGSAIGMGLSVLATRTVDKALGDSYSVKKEKAQLEASANEIAADNEAFDELKTAAAQKIAYEEENGISSDDTKYIKSELEKYQGNEGSTSFGALTQSDEANYEANLIKQIRQNELDEIDNRHKRGIYKMSELQFGDNKQLNPSLFQITDEMLENRKNDADIC